MDFDRYFRKWPNEVIEYEIRYSGMIDKMERSTNITSEIDEFGTPPFTRIIKYSGKNIPDFIFVDSY